VISDSLIIKNSPAVQWLSWYDYE